MTSPNPYTQPPPLMTRTVVLHWLEAMQARVPDDEANEFDEVPPTVMRQLLHMLQRQAEIMDYIVRGQLDTPWRDSAADNVHRLIVQEYDEDGDEDGAPLIMFTPGQRKKLR